jgi:hypothetical protein
MYFPLTRTRKQKLNGFDMICLLDAFFWCFILILGAHLEIGKRSLDHIFSTATRCNGSKYVFPDTDVCSAAAFGRFLCRDYDSAEEEPWF